MKALVFVFLLVYMFAPIHLDRRSIKTVQATAIAVAISCESPYIVSPGESLSAIAKRCKTTQATILRLNPGLHNPHRIYAGQRLVLAEETSSQPVIPVTGEQTYIVKTGDTLGRIANRAGLTISQLMIANPTIIDPNRIYPGQQLRIPGSDSVSSDADWRNDRISRSIDRQQNNGLRYQPLREGERWIHVDLATQTVHAYEGNTIVRSFIVSSGKSSTPTVTGTYPIWIKLRYDDMRGPGYFLRDVPYVMYFYKGYGLHGTYWHNNFGSPMSAGCVNLTIDDAAWLYDFASVGTVVNVE